MAIGWRRIARAKPSHILVKGLLLTANRSSIVEACKCTLVGIALVLFCPLASAAPTVVISPSTIDFGVRPGSPFGDQPLTGTLIDGLVGISINGTLGEPIDVEVRNAGPGPLTLRDIEVDGALLFPRCGEDVGGTGVDTCRVVIQEHQCGDAFYLDGQLASIFPLVIQEGVSCHFSLYYVQSGLGDLHGTFSVASDAASSPDVIPITASRSTPVFFGVPVTDTARAIVSLDDPTGCGFTGAAWLAPPEGSSATRGFAFPHGLFHLELHPCLPGETKSVRIEFSDPLPAGTKYLKFGPTPDNHVPHWYEIPSTVEGNAIEFAVTDGGLGDDDLTANGVIVDEGGPAIPLSVAVATAVPTLSPYALIALAMFLLWPGMSAIRRRRR